MKKILGFIVGAGVIVALGIWFINNNPTFFQQIIDWAMGQMGIN